MIHGPLSDDFFWYDESESYPEFQEHWDNHNSSPSADDWGWDEWGDLVVFRPVHHEPNYRYPLVVWLSQDEVAGVTLRDWFPELSERNYLGAEIGCPGQTPTTQLIDQVSVAIREIAAIYRVHPHRVWIAGVGVAADQVVQILMASPALVRGGIAIAPTGLAATASEQSAALHNTREVRDKSLYLATESNLDPARVESFLEDWDLRGGHSQQTAWESTLASRLAICNDLNGWLMQQVCTPAETDTR